MISPLRRPHMWLRSFPRVWMLFPLLGRVSASASVTASPTNDTQALTQQDGSLEFLLTNTENAFSTAINLAPLTSSVATLSYNQFQQFQAQGVLVLTTPSRTSSVTPQDISLISCDPSAYPGFLDVAQTVSDVVSLTSGGPAAVLLYSAESYYCNYTVNDPTIDYSNVFTILTTSASQAVLSHLSSSKINATVDNSISVITGNMSTSSSASGFGGNNSTSSDSGVTTSSSTTAVAMIILYTVTGIITALFLGIIITGAVRAHRHPERYGPRNITGRPRQSRARGLARAMLETIPIVKFGDPDDANVVPAKRDLEMASRNDEEGSTHDAPTEAPTTEQMTTDAERTATDAETAEAQPEMSDTIDADNTVTSPAAAVAAAGTTTAGTSSPAPPRDVTEMGNNVCPICTDDFVKGQDVRLLPCNHQFHPECIDPWLINVSGTCPLCRIDLNPALSEAAHEDHDHDGSEDGAAAHRTHPDEGDTTVPTMTTATNRLSYHRGIAGLLSDIRLTRNAPVEERIEALRRLRESSARRENNEESNTTTTTEESQGLRRHLTTRLRERFRIRTRQHEGSAPTQSASQ